LSAGRANARQRMPTNYSRGQEALRASRNEPFARLIHRAGVCRASARRNATSGGITMNTVASASASMQVFAMAVADLQAEGRLGERGMVGSR